MDETSPGSDKKPSGKDLRTAIDNLETIDLYPMINILNGMQY